MSIEMRKKKRYGLSFFFYDFKKREFAKKINLSFLFGGVCKKRETQNARSFEKNLLQKAENFKIYFQTQTFFQICVWK